MFDEEVKVHIHGREVRGHLQSVLSMGLYIGYGDRTEVSRLDSKHLSLQSHPTDP